MRKLFALLLTALLIAPATAMAVDDAKTIEDLRKQIEELSTQLEDISGRVDKNEKKTATDRINWYGDLRVKGDSLHYQDVTVNQGFLVDFDNSFDTLTTNPDFGFPDGMAGAALLPAFGSDGDPTSAATQSALNAIMGMFAADPRFAAVLAQNPGLAPAFQGYLLGMPLGKGVFPAPTNDKFDVDNDILYTTRLRLGMKAKVWDNVDFSGRLNMYKNWGDSTGTKVMDSFSSFTMDGTNSGNTTGDFLRVERAYFDWKDIGGSNFYLSIGRRPSTYGPPTQYRENELRGGTPSGHLVNFNFDGITAGYKLGEITGVEGQTVRFCYGQGFESEFGNGSLFAEADLEDTHLGGFNIDAINDGTNFLQFTLFGAKDVADSFKGLAVLPFADNNGDGIPEGMNSGAFISRFQGQENIGDMLLGGIGFSREEMNGVNWFISGAWTRTLGNNNFNPMGLGGLLADAVPVMEVTSIDVNLAGEPVIGLEFTGDYVTKGLGEDRDGYSAYVGFQVPAPMGKLGLEYNYGSKYWTPFTQAQDDIIGSKLAARGHVGEAYYIFDVNPNMFIKVGGIYYDYEYTGSGSPVGLPKKVEDVQDGKEFSMFPVIDKAWDLNASLTVKF
jgi:hypothetical protein